ncbi:PREDICTED: E3 UFM1-protein ligase 1-like [Priapulus caudatus]|uniref:E3 UFM1-protein ligase 1 homolog n=1 Tax=Priapulus caudatus TaxID=37621 RepID=A0ABM1F273_PRICU|nr:PREDICTED: E3 UFM1-protein ligase 1-like [Priapulus caudatus]
MAASEWEEVKRLAADFQKAQLQGTVQRLSERNCIQIVQQLVDRRLLEVLYTLDGRTYLTPRELARGVRDELAARGGRAAVADLARDLNVDYGHVEMKVAEMVKVDPSLQVTLGQVIDRSYIDRLAEEIDDKLQDAGYVRLADLIKLYDLPSDFLSAEISSRLGTRIRGRADDDGDILTDAYLSRERARVRGALAGTTRPTPARAIVARHGFRERLFAAVAAELSRAGEVGGAVAGGAWVPAGYARAQADHVRASYARNGYLEYDSLARVGVADPEGYVRRLLKDESLLYLSSCCCGASLEQQVEAALEEAAAAEGATVGDDGSVASAAFVEACARGFDDEIARAAAVAAATKRPAEERKPKEEAKEGRQGKKEERRQKAVGGARGGGNQGRETKQKSLKKKGRGGARGGDDDDGGGGGGGGGEAAAAEEEPEFLSADQLEEALSARTEKEGCPEELTRAIAERLRRPLARRYRDAVAAARAATFTAGSSSRRRAHDELSEKVNGLVANMRMFERGVATFPEADARPALARYLIRTAGAEITHLIIAYLASDDGGAPAVTPENCRQVASGIGDAGARASAVALAAEAVAGTELDGFHSRLDEALERCQVLVRKLDKKKEKQMAYGHRMALADQLREETNPAATLHLAALLLHHVHAQRPLVAPGRLVPTVLAALRGRVADGDHDVLLSCQELVVRLWILQFETAP